MATSPSEPPPKHVKLRYRALAYVRRIGRRRQPNRPRAITRRSFVDTSGGCPPIRLSSADGGTNNVGYADSNGLRPVVRIISKRSFGDSGSARPAVRIGNRKSLIDPSGSKPVASLDARRSNLDSNDAVFTTGEIKVNKRTRRSRKKPRKTRDKGKNRHHRFLSLFHDHDGPQYLLFGGCCVKQEAFDPAETPSFHWGVGFDESYYHTPSYQPLSNGTKLRLQLSGLDVTSRGDQVGHSGDLSSIGARAASFDSGFGFTCESPVSCPLPLGLAPTRTLPTMLNLRPRDGTGNGKFTLNSENGGFLSTGIKRKEPPPSSGYPSYTRTTPPSPFLNDFTLAGTLNNTRVRSRVSVGCNGWFLNDDDPVNSGWYRRCSSDEVKSNTSDETGFDRGSPKRYKRSPRGESSSSVEDFHSSSTNSRTSRVSIVLLSQDGSVSSAKGDHGWLASSGIALVPLPASSPPSTSRHLHTSASPSLLVPCQDSSQTYDSGGIWQGDSENDDCAPPTKRRRSIASSSNSSGGIGLKNLPRVSMDEVERESLNIQRSFSARASTSLSARFSASLRLTRSLSPRTLKRALSPGRRHREGRRSCSHSTSRSRRIFHLGHSNSIPKTSSSPLAAVKTAPNPSIVFIDC